ncbi:MAG: glycosyltransferase family 2 protein [Planctomycetota bacterium]
MLAAIRGVDAWEPGPDITFPSGNRTKATMTASSGEVLSTSGPKYSVVIPVYRSAPILPELLRRLDAFFDGHQLRHEYIFVNDGSPDDSWKVLAQLKQGRNDIIAIDLMRNYGQHSAMFCGFQQATGDFVITMDDDLQNPPEEIIHLIKKRRRRATTWCSASFTRRCTAASALGSRLIGWLNYRLFDKPPDLVLTNFRLIRREVVDAVCDYQTTFPYIPGLVLMSGRTFANAKVKHMPRTVGQSGYGIKTILQLVWRIVFNYSPFPMRLLCGIGGLASFASFLLGIFYLARNLLFGTRVPGWTTLAVLLSFQTGFILLLFAAQGEYLVRIMGETSGRKAYRIRRKI